MASTYLSVREASEDLGMNYAFILGEIKRGKLPVLKMSRNKYLINKGDWEHYKKSKEMKGGSEW